MAFTDEDRKRMIQTETKVSTMHDAMFTEDGLSRCATHSTKIESIEKAVDSNQKWTKGLIASFLGSIFLAIVALITRSP
jgi:hypothetical protein